MGNCECGCLKGNPCGPLRLNTINVTMPTGSLNFQPVPPQRESSSLTFKRSPSQITELLRSGGGVRAVKVILCVALFAAAAMAQSSTSYGIDTFAGLRVSGDGGPAVEAWLDSPRGVAVDLAGNVYIADTYNHRVRRVDATGTITTITGTGEYGFGGDGGPASQAQLAFPDDVAADRAGNVYIADRYNYRIRKVDATGTITTFAGTGEYGFGGDGGPARRAQLSEPGGIALDVAGNVYIADTYNHRIRKVDAAGTITTIAGSGERGFSGDGGPASQAQLSAPFDVAADGSGNVYFADYTNHRIRKVDAAGTITTFAGTGETGFSPDEGPAVEASLGYPRGVAVDGAGNVYISPGGLGIGKVDSTGTITTIAGTGGGFGGDGGPASQARFHEPFGVAVDVAGNLYIADSGNHRIRKVDATGTITTIAGRTFSGDGGPASQAQLSEPEGVAADRAGNLYISDSNNHRIRKVDFAGTITTIAGTRESGFSGDGGPASQAQLGYPRGVAVDGLGNLYIGDRNNQRIRKVDLTGTITTIAGTGEYGFGGDGGPASQARFREPFGVAVDGLGNLYIGDRNNQRIRKVDLTGTITTIAGTGERGFGGDGGPASQAQLSEPEGVAVDEAGNLYIADSFNDRIRKVDATGTITTIAGTGEYGFGGDGGPASQAQFRHPTGVAVDGLGNLYIVDGFNNRIRKVDATGTITTIAGSGERGFAGDSGPAVEAALDLPVDAAVDRAGYVYIADWLNHVIRKLAPMTGPVTTVPVIPGGSGSFSISATTPSSLTVEWKEPENTGSAITDYDVRYREVGSGSDFIDAQHTGTARSATLTGLSPGTAYEVEVRATNAAGTGAWSQLGIVRTSPLPTGGQIYYFPHLAVGASWQTTITYINFSPQEVTCQTDFLSDHGSPLMVSFAELGTVDSRTDVLPAGGSVHQETNVDLSAPLAPGWARATCSGPVQASLLYRQHNSEGVPTAEAGVNATAVPATRFVTFAEQGEGQFGTGVAYANPSATPAFVTFTVRDTAGEVLASVDRTLLPGGHDAHGMAELFDLTSFTGSIEVTSTEPIVSLSINLEAAPVFSSLPPGELDAAAQGSSTYYFPHLAVGASWQTTITYINFSSQEVTCQTDFLSDQGTPLMVSFADKGTVPSRADVLLPGGSVHQETDVDLSASLAPGWARATCSGPVKASLLYRLRDSEGAPVAEAGINAAAVPATRFVTFAEQGEGQFGTGVAYANPFFTSAHVTFTARDTTGEVLASADRTLLPGGHDAHGMGSLFGLTSFTGSLEVTSTVPIVSLSINLEAAPVFSSLPPGDIPGVMLAPTDEAAFNELVVGKRVLGDHPAFYTDFVSPGRFRDYGGSDIWTGSYTYRNTGPNTGTVTFNYDDGDRCVASFTFVSTTAGTATFTCDDGSSGGSNWLLVAISATGTPDLVVQTLSVSDSNPNAGESFTLSAAVRNQGNGLSASTTLRYYRSTDATISTSDTAVGTDAVDALTPAGTSDESISLTAPSTAGTYYYGACVDPVSGESNSQNNCSSAMRVTVAQVSDEDVYVRHESLTIGRGWVRYLNATDYASGSGCIDLTGSTILHNGVPYILISSKWQTRANSSDAWADIPDTSESGSLCAYDPVDPGEYRFVAEISIGGVVGKYSSNILGEGFDLASANRDASGITYANGKFYVEGRKGFFTRKVYAYEPSGQRDPDSDFDLDSANIEGITYANDRFYAVDLHDQQAYAYHASGQRDSASDFDLDPDNNRAGGITFGNDRFFVVDWDDDKVYAYQVSGQRDSASDFDLDPDNNRASGITFGNDRFFVVDWDDDKVYAYQVSGQRDSASDFDLDPDNDDAGGITFANDQLYVVDSGDDKVYAYSAGAGPGTTDSQPSFGSATASDQSYQAGAAISALTLPAASGGDGTLTYSLSPAVAGLSFNATTRVLSGTPTTVGSYGMAYTARDADGDIATLRFTITVAGSGSFAPAAPQVAARSGTDTELEVTFTDSFEAGEARAYDFEVRPKTPPGSWSGGCNVFTNTSSNAGTTSLTQGITGLQPGTVYQVRYRYRNSSSCDSGSPGQWSEIGEGATSGGGTGGTQLAFSEGESATRGIWENTPPGINVGGPVSAVGGDSLTYTISGTDSESFVILPETGQIRTRENVVYDYEVKNRYAVTVGVEDDDGNSDTIDVTILIGDLVPSCGPPSNIRVNHSDGRLTLRWSPLSDIIGHARVLGYQTEIRRGASGVWGDGRTFLGRNIDAMIYAGLDNEIGYQVRVRPINAEGDCQWSTPVSGIPTADRAPEDDDDYHDRFGPHPLGTPERSLRLLTPGRCRHTSNGQTLDADCEYENTGPDSGRIFLEFDDPSQGSCEITLAYSSLTAGSFIDECFDAGVNTNVPFERSFRMPRLSGQDGEVEVPRAPRSQEEFDVLAWGRDDFIPGFGFGCPPVESCEFLPGNGYTVARDPATGLPVWTLGEYTYMNTGASTGVLTFRDDMGGSYTFTLDFDGPGSVRATIEAPAGGAAVWPGIPHLDLTLGAQPVLLPIPPSWSAALAIEADFAPEPANANRVRKELLDRFFPDFTALLGAEGGLQYRQNYLRLGRNRAIQTIEFPWRDPKVISGRDEAETARKLTLNGTTWSFNLTFTSDGAARFTLTVTKEGYLPTVVEGVVDFHGDGISVDEFPEELLLPDDPPQASGEDVSGVEVAAAVSVGRIGQDDVQTFLVSNSGAAYRPGDWLEPKDGSNQRMMIVGTSQISAVASTALSPVASPQFDRQILKTQTAVSSHGSPLFAAAMAPFGGRASRAAALTSNATITEVSVVCMQIGHDIPTRGARYFSQPKTPQDAVQLCQQKCVLDGMDNIQGCVWSCEANAGGN